MNPATFNRRLFLTMGQLWLANIFASLLLYLFHLAVARSLTTEEYGLFGALFGIVYMTYAVSNGVQVSIARFVASSRASSDGADSGLLVTSALFQMFFLGCVFFIAFSLASPLIGSYLHSNGLAPVITTGAAIFVFFLMPVPLGALQGAQRFSLFAATLIALASSRFLFGLATLAINLGVTGVLVGVGLSGLLTMALGLAAVRPSFTLSTKALPVGTFAKVLVPALIGSLAISVPTSADVVIVRHFFLPIESGLYTGVSILGRMILFVSLAVSMVLFPKVVHEWSLGNPTRGLLYKGLGVTAIFSGGVSLCFILLPKFALTIFLGSNYSGAEDLVPLYAGAMFLFSLAVAFLYYHLATNRISYLYRLLLPHIVLELGLIYVFHQSLTEVIIVLLSVNASLVISSSLFTALAREQAPDVQRAAEISSLGV